MPWPPTPTGEHRRLAARFDHLQQDLHRHRRLQPGPQDRAGPRRAAAFPSETFPSRSSRFSGGEQNRLMLPKLLLAEPDLMLLDEPSNHLDIQATAWLEEFLGQPPCGDGRGEPRPLLPRPGDQSHAGTLPRHRRRLRRQLLGLLAAEGRSARWSSGGPTKSSRRRSPRPRSSSAATTTGRSTPRPKTAARSSTADRAGRAAAGDRRPADGLLRGRAERRPGAAGRELAKAYDRPLFGTLRWTSSAGSGGASWGRTAAARPRSCGASWAS